MELFPKNGINEEALERTRTLLKHGERLNMVMLGEIFGQPFWELVVLTHANVELGRSKIYLTIKTS